jgi:hypothetical protein
MAHFLKRSALDEAICKELHMNIKCTFLSFTISVIGILGCHQTKPSQSEQLDAKQDIYQKLQLHQTTLVEHLEAAVREFKKSGTTDLTLVPSLINCRARVRFSINIREAGLTGKTIITATMTNGRLSRVLGIDLIPGKPKQVKIFYKISNLSFDHEIPMIPPGPQNALPILTEPEVTTRRIYKDFATFYRGKDPEEFIVTPINSDLQAGYLHWLWAMGELNDYLVNLQDYHKSQ